MQKQKFERVSQLELLKLVYELLLSKAEPELWEKLYSEKAIEAREKEKEKPYYEYRLLPGKQALQFSRSLIFH